MTSPPAKDKELHDTTGKRQSPPPAQDFYVHPFTEQPDLLPSTDRETYQPLPSTQQPVYVTAKDSSSSGFFVFEQNVQNIDKNACRKMFRALEPFRKRRLWWMNPTRMMRLQCWNFLVVIKKYQHKELLKDLGIPVMTVEEFWEDGDKYYHKFEYGKLIIIKQAHAKLLCPLSRLDEWYYPACVRGLQFIEGCVHEVVFKSQNFDLNIELFERHIINWPRMLDITMMTVFCM
jgi:hypothetical protein